MEFLVVVVFVVVLLVIFALASRNKKPAAGAQLPAASDEPAPRTHFDDVKDAYATLMSTGKASFTEDVSGFRLKKGERLIFSAPALPGTSKVVTTRKATRQYAGVNYRVRVAKGLSFNVGSMMMSSPAVRERMWVHDRENIGMLHFTTDRIIFNGAHKNITTQMHKLIELTLSECGEEIYMDRDTGPDISFTFDRPISATLLATALAYAKGVAIEAPEELE